VPGSSGYAGQARTWPARRRAHLAAVPGHPGPALTPPNGTEPTPFGASPERSPAPRQVELTALCADGAIPESRGARRVTPGLHWPGGRTRKYRVRPGGPARRREPAGVRARTGGGLGDIGRAWAVPASRGDQDNPRRRLDRQHQPDARTVCRGRRLPDPAASGGRRGGSSRRLAGARGNGHGGLAGHAGRRAADCRDGPRTAPAAGRGRARRQPGTGGRRRHAAAALPGPDDQTVPRGADVVPAVAARPERDVPLAAHPGDRKGGAGGDRRASRARTVRYRLRVPRPAVGARRRARQGAPP
jgi:hypothetical protein